MDTIVQKNITILSSQNPSLKNKLLPKDSLEPYRYVREPKPNILVGKGFYHSIKDPEREAKNLVEGLTVRKGFLFLFLGVGLAYHIELFKKLYQEAGEVTIIAVERSPEAFTILMQRRELSFLQGIHLLIDESPHRVERFFHSLDPLSFKGYRVIRLRGAYSFFREYYGEIETCFKRVMSSKLSDILTRFAFESLWMKNIVKNVPYLCGKSPINPLKNTLRNKAALVIAAGPSLNDQLNLIKEISGSIYLIAVDTALEPLLHRNIWPDFVVSLDGQYFTLSHFHTVLSGRDFPHPPILIADVVCQPLVLKHWHGPLYFSATASNSADEVHPLVHMLSERFLPLHMLPCGGSVATTAIEFALFLGSNPVLVTGLDLSFTFFHTHASETSNDLYFRQLSNRLKTVHSLAGERIHRRNLLFLPGLDGEKVLSDFVFGNYLDWFSQKEEYLNRVYNVTVRGAEVAPLAHFRLEDFRPEKNKEKALSPRFCLRMKGAKRGKDSTHAPAEKELSHDVCMQFLADLKHEIPRARATLSMNSDQKGTVHFADARYPQDALHPLLKNILPLAISIHRDLVSASSHVHLFLDMLEKNVCRSIRHMKTKDH
jgi:hypothetical protein